MQIKPLLPPIIVNGVTLDPARIAAEAQNHPAPKGKPGAAWKAAARALAIRELLLQEVARRDLDATPAEIAPGQWETEDEARIAALLDAAITPEPADEGQLRALYDAHPDRFRAPSLYEAAHILLPVAPDDPKARAEAEDTARSLIADLKTAPQKFAAMAEEYSACSSKNAGGVLGQLSSGDTVPEFEAALSRMQEDSIADQPVRSRYGLHVVRLDAMVRGEVLPFDTVLPRLREAHDKAAWLRACHAFIAGLIRKAKIIGLTIDTDSALPFARQEG
ncbi:peptidylprolyl isomerase [Paracoccus fistulariae]|uniref:Parvulin-like PPIase n=1 Tax=Paracoccus fistulariae TaxID=658446 RepID=A0ABY7SKL5_9RHOB|nr:peptidylprolyl isomerase [Paracoccus fistulariae]MDB6181312.1 peptidylprolyl isomerase [Paracoccus fistulariae]WCR07361.1 peptidyl-prolyl cis-trans isomerase [Paracoccus fistulariae]